MEVWNSLKSAFTFEAAIQFLTNQFKNLYLKCVGKEKDVGLGEQMLFFLLFPSNHPVLSAGKHLEAFNALAEINKDGEKVFLQFSIFQSSNIILWLFLVSSETFSEI